MSVDFKDRYPRDERISRNLSIHATRMDLTAEDVTDGIDFDPEDYVRDEPIVLISSKDEFTFSFDYEDNVIEVYDGGTLVEESISVSDVDIVVIGTG